MDGHKVELKGGWVREKEIDEENVARNTRETTHCLPKTVKKEFCGVVGCWERVVEDEVIVQIFSCHVRDLAGDGRK